MREFIAKMVDNDFKTMLHARKYDGILKFDHENQKLDIKVYIFNF